MYSGGPEFWNRRNHTDRTLKKATVGDALKRTLHPASFPKSLETPQEIKSVIRKRILNKDDHGDRLSQYSFKENVGLNNLIRAFHRTHRGPDNYVDAIEFKLGLQEFAISASDEAIEELFREYTHNGISVNYVEFAHKVCFQEDTKNSLQALIDKIKDVHNMNATLLSSISQPYLSKGLINTYDFIEVLSKFVGYKVSSWDVDAMCEDVEKVNGMIVFQDFFDNILGCPSLGKEVFSPASRKALSVRLTPLVETTQTSGEIASQENEKNAANGAEVPQVPMFQASTPDNMNLSLKKKGKLRPMTSSRSLRSKSSRSSTTSNRPGTALFTPKYKSRSVRPSTGSSSAETLISLHRSLLRTFLGLDFVRSGTVSVQDFRTVLQQHGGGGLSPENYSDLIMTKPGVEEDGNINYMNFLHHLSALHEQTTNGRRSPEIFI